MSISNMTQLSNTFEGQRGYKSFLIDLFDDDNLCVHSL